MLAFNHLPLPTNRQSPDGMVAKMVAEHQTSYFLRIVQFSRNFGCGWVGGVGKRGEDGSTNCCDLFFFLEHSNSAKFCNLFFGSVFVYFCLKLCEFMSKVKNPPSYLNKPDRMPYVPVIEWFTMLEAVSSFY